MKNIHFITALHGDESVPVNALASKNIPQTIANPLAIEKNVRFIDMDMNKAFKTDGTSYEEKRAQEILSILQKMAPEYIIDFHTTSAITDAFAIIVDPALLPAALTLGVKHIVYMKHNIKNGHALINHYPGVSVEAGTHTDPEVKSRVISITENALNGELHESDLYEVYDTITTPGEYINFQEHSEGFIPVLAGERSYNFYGLKARKVRAFS